MKKKTLLPILALFSILSGALSACFYDNEEDLYGSGCSTENLTYTNEIKQLLQNNCYSCHTTVSNVAGTPFGDSYTTVKTYVNNGLIVARINDKSKPMPPTGLMDACSVDKIEAWIKAGAPEN